MLYLSPNSFRPGSFAANYTTVARNNRRRRARRAEEGGDPPVISGTGYPGETLTSTQAGQWRINGIDVVGETGDSFVVPLTVVPGDVITQPDSNEIVVEEYDADALSHIEAVEIADGQSLEPAIKWARNEFFLGLKATAAPIDATNWDAIAAGIACLTSGARTIAGALVPLKSTMPTPSNVGFVSGDYHRNTGLKGNGSSKYLDQNRTISGDLLDNHHQSVWVSSVVNNLSRGLIGSGTGQNGATCLLSQGAARSRSSSAAFPTAGVAGKLVGCSRSSSANVVLRSAGISNTATLASVQLPTGSSHVFSRGGADVATSGTDARIAFFSEGHAIDLPVVEGLLDAYFAKVDAILIPTFDADAANYIQRVETADGQALEPRTRIAMNELIVGMKNTASPVAASMWDAESFACLMIGPRTLAGALVTLKPTMPTPTNLNFVSGDYNRRLGLKGNTTTKRIESGLSTSSIPQNDAHVAAYITEADSRAARVDYLGNYLGSGNPSVIIRMNEGTPDVIGLQSVNPLSFGDVDRTVLGLVGVSRANGTDLNYLVHGTSGTGTQATTTVLNQQIIFFHLGGPSAVNMTTARMGFISAGRGVNLAAMQTLLNEYKAAIAVSTL